ncbi:PREDICTED: monocyte to macrophage differentiation factor-like isoform X2 [Priapulus caudatus]|uniref:Monocyte to macrophage differentiation factor-like isoform X2 n=1 Tax=Priapulus caudatus TaxID=37621 RepID=A0ABM1EGE7_PRICU|nr:PREDICTED: monocyte to macrophage differentiation factor-like isoform X2 [Priapulus caudatus]
MFMNYRANGNMAYVPTPFEHVANIVTHGIFIIPAAYCLFFMIERSQTPTQYFNALVYGGALIALFTMSTTWHTISYTGACRGCKDFFHIGDRAVIYIFIAASYTPWLTMKRVLSDGSQWVYLMWMLAFLGIVYQYTFHEKHKWLATLFYVGVSLVPGLGFAWMCTHDLSGVHEMALGGAFFLTGVVFFKSDGLVPFAHAIWHLFVVAGAACQLYAVCKYLMIPMATA